MANHNPNFYADNDDDDDDSLVTSLRIHLHVALDHLSGAGSTG